MWELVLPFHRGTRGSSSGHKAPSQEPLPVEPAEGDLCLDIICKADGDLRDPMIVSHERSSVLGCTPFLCVDSPGLQTFRKTRLWTKSCVDDACDLQEGKGRTLLCIFFNLRISDFSTLSILFSNHSQKLPR